MKATALNLFKLVCAICLVFAWCFTCQFGFEKYQLRIDHKAALKNIDTVVAEHIRINSK